MLIRVHVCRCVFQLINPLMHPRLAMAIPGMHVKNSIFSQRPVSLFSEYLPIKSRPRVHKPPPAQTNTKECVASGSQKSPQRRYHRKRSRRRRRRKMSSGVRKRTTRGAIAEPEHSGPEIEQGDSNDIEVKEGESGDELEDTMNVEEESQGDAEPEVSKNDENSEDACVLKNNWLVDAGVLLYSRSLFKLCIRCHGLRSVVTVYPLSLSIRCHGHVPPV